MINNSLQKKIYVKNNDKKCDKEKKQKIVTS